METFKILNLRSRCFEDNTNDLDVPRLIQVDEKHSADLEYSTIFYLITLSWTLTHKDHGIILQDQG